MSLTRTFDAGGLKSVSYGPEMQGSRSLERTYSNKRTAWAVTCMAFERVDCR